MGSSMDSADALLAGGVNRYCAWAALKLDCWLDGLGADGRGPLVRSTWFLFQWWWF